MCPFTKPQAPSFHVACSQTLGPPPGLSAPTSTAVPNVLVDQTNGLLERSTNAWNTVSSVVTAVDNMRCQVHATNKRLEGEVNNLICALTKVTLTQMGWNTTNPSEVKPSPAAQPVQEVDLASSALSMPALEPVSTSAEELLTMIEHLLLPSPGVILLSPLRASTPLDCASRISKSS
ncbi:hypothetical protein FRC12_024849 [Ceratobasidium sp. 428]|nr:hypothetical protein FRC12_024849 [Ceratobasidium sp. 428]